MTRHDNRWKPLLLGAILVAGALLAWWLAERIDREMREDLRSQARIVAEALNIERIKALTGSEADLASPEYQRLKEQFVAVCEAIPQCRFAYLMGRRSNLSVGVNATQADGSIFFFVDSEPPVSGDYSPPGQVYEEASDSDRLAFSSEAPTVTGPVNDRWGTWITALVPIDDKASARIGMASPADAQALVRKAVEFARIYGQDRLLQEINNPQGVFRKGVLYAFAYDHSATVVAHPVKPELIGVTLLDKKDWHGGRYFHREIRDLALSKGNGWVDYEYENPASGKIEPKSTYVERLNDLIICAGAHRGTGSIVAVLGMDIDAHAWKWEVFVRAVLPVIFAASALIVIMFSGSFLLAQRARLDIPPPWMGQLEPLLTLAAGFVLTIFAAWFAQDAANRNVSHTFQNLAEPRTATLAEAFRDLRDVELEGLARFYEGSDTISAEEFIRYVHYLTRNRAVQAWEWIPAVPASAKGHFEQAARAAGLHDFEIWQKNAAGQRVPASGRETYYPVFRVAPVEGNTEAIGFDLGSEPVRRAAIEEALRTGLTTATDPVTLLQETGNQKCMLVFRPVFADADRKKALGLALAALRLDEVLAVTNHDSLMDTTLLLARGASPPEPVASFRAAGAQASTAITFHRPVFCFGKTFIVVAHAGQGFLRSQSVREGLITGLTGLLLTATLAIIVSVLRYRSQALESLVRERTAALRESEEHLSATLRSIGDGVIACDNEGRVASLNPSAEGLTGWTSDEAAGRPIQDVFRIVNGQTRETAENPVFRALREGVNVDLAVHTVLISRNGTEYQIADSCAPIRDASKSVIGAVLVFRDETENYRRQEELRKIATFQSELLLNLPAGVVIIDPVTRQIEQINEHAAALFGAPVNRLLGQRCHAFLCPAAEGACPVCDLGNTVDNSERVMLRADGSRLPILKTVKRLVLGGQEKLMECFVDISDRKQAEETLRESEESYRRQFADNSSIMLLVDPEDGRLMDANTAAAKFYGYDRDQLLTMSITDINPLPREALFQAMASVAPKQGKHFAFQHRLADGSMREVEVFSSLVVLGARPALHSIVHDITDRKAAEEALKRERDLFAAGPVFTIEWALTEGWPVRFVSENVREILGYSASEMMSQDFVYLALIHPDDRERVTQEAKDNIANHIDHCEQSYRLRMKDGEYRWFSDFTMRTRNYQNVLTSIRGYIYDQTMQKKAELELATERTRLAGILEGTHVGTWEWNVQTGETLFNERWAEMIGWTLDELSPVSIETWTKFTHPDDLKLSGALLEKHFAGELENFECESRMRHKNGEWVWVLDRGKVATWTEDGKPLIMMGTHQDITNRKQAEASLLHQKAHFESLFTNTNDAMIFFDTEHRIVNVNAVFTSIFGYTLDEVLYKNINTVVDPLRQAHEYGSPRILRGEQIEMDVIRYAKSGEPRNVLLKGGPVRQLDEIVGGYAIYSDITDRKLAEQELLKTNRELEEANDRANGLAEEATIASRAKSEFLANMSHEIRTPMNGVIGMTGLLLDTDLTGDQRRYAEIVKSSGESLLGLINDILDFSKIEAGKLDLETLDFELQSLLDDFASTMAIKTHDKGLELLCAADPDVPTLLMGDPGRLRQILTNLTGNAVKFTQQGEVAVRVETVLESGRDDSCLLRFSVRDTGIGIPPDKIGTLFSKFTQVDASTTRQYGGTGLGLSISKQLAELMGGEIGVKSVLGQGSEFWFTARFGVREDAVQEEKSPSNLVGVRTLIVDDNATNREILSTRLISWGMCPEETPDGPSGLQALYCALGENNPFKLAIIDMQMPGMDGEALGRAIKADARLTDTRLVMLTSLGARGDANRLQEIGFSAYATKPIQHQLLKTVLSQALSTSEDEQSRPFATRHTAREALPRFINCKARILLAEDNITNQQVAQGILKKLGLAADAVANGREAIDALKTLPYDLVLMDVQMPEMDGMEATRHIRNPLSAMTNRHIPIIAMTAHAMQGDKERCLEAGMNDYVTKPVSIQALAKTLEKWLPRETTESVIQEPTDKNRLENGPSDPIIFDREALLNRVQGDQELTTLVLQGFLEDIPRQIVALRKYLETGDVAGAERQAHTIKGASANVGAEALCILCGDLESAGNAGKLDIIQARLNELDAAFETLRHAMQGDMP